MSRRCAAVDADALATVSEETLVERAGTAVATWAVRMLGGTYGRHVVVVAGKGNNGADGRVAAARLRRRGARVTVVDAGDAPDRIGAGGDASTSSSTPPTGPGSAAPTGPRPCRAGVPVLAVDIPSGVDGDTGEACGEPLRADVTVTFAALKTGPRPRRRLVAGGRVEVADIGLDVSRARMWVVEDADVARLLAPRPRDAHKWQSAVAVVAGSPGMTGAAGLCARAAYRAGAGMVRLGIPGGDPVRSPRERSRRRRPCPRRVGLPTRSPCRNGAGHSWSVPGWVAPTPPSADVRASWPRPTVPVVVDADGLYALGTGDEIGAVVHARLRTRRRSTVVLTPHDGEFTRLAGAPPGTDRIAAAGALAQRCGAVVLLKGPTTIVADPAGTVLLATAGSPRLATAGTGDVLSGAIGAFVARGVEPRPRGRSGRARPRAGRRARPRRGPRGRGPGRAARPMAVGGPAMSRADVRGASSVDARRSWGRDRCGPRSTWAPSATTPSLLAPGRRPRRAVRGGQGRRLRARRGGGGPSRARGRRHLVGGGDTRRGRARCSTPASAPPCSSCPSLPPRPWRDVVGRGLTPGAVLAPAVQAAAGGLGACRAWSPTSTSRWTPACIASAPTPPSSSRSVQAVAAEPSLRFAALWTHFPVADGVEDEDRSFTEAQIRASRTRPGTLLAGAGHAPPMLHAANSAGALGVPGGPPRHGAVRHRPVRGLSLPRGRLRSSPQVMDGTGAAALRPVLSLRAKVTLVRRLDADERPSYGRLVRPAGRRSTVATVPLGYADGVPRRYFTRGGTVLVGGRRRPLAGMVTMDQIVVDCGPDDDVAVGDDVVLIGEQGAESLTASDWADVLGTIAHEVFCGIGPRVPRVVVDREGQTMSDKRPSVQSRLVRGVAAGDRRRAGRGVGGAAPPGGPQPHDRRRHRGRGAHRSR